MIRDVASTAIDDIAEPTLQPDDVLLQVNHVGLCGSDLNSFMGRNPLAQLPLIPGHEISGTVIGLGANVPGDVAVGDSAIVIPYIACGACSACRADRRNACRNNKTLGVQRQGGMVERIALPADSIITGSGLPSRLRALVEPLAVGFHAVRRARIRAGEQVVVIGGGMIGIGAMIGAIRQGADVTAIEVSDSKRELLLGIGVARVINPVSDDVAEAIAFVTGGEGADVVIEAVGLPETFRSAIDHACYGGRVVYLGYAKDRVDYDTKYFNLKELDILGSRNATRQDFNDVIAYLTARPAEAEQLISRTFDWAEADQAFQYWDSVRSSVFKIMIEVADA